MDDNRWHQLITDISSDDIERMVEACEHLKKEAETSDVPRLLRLLGDKNFVVREAAAWPLASLGEVTALPELFTSLRRGYDEGLDNDGFQSALIALVQLYPQRSREKLLELKRTPDPVLQEYASWLLEFC